MTDRERGPSIDVRIREASELVDIVAATLARRMGPHASLEDLRAFGRAALLQVATTYDSTRGDFRTWASKKLRWAILDGLRRELRGRAAVRARALVAAERVVHDAASIVLEDPPTTEDAYEAELRRLLVGQAAALGVVLVADPSTPEANTPENAVMREQWLATVREAVTRLSSRERTLVERHYFAGDALDDIAKDLGISKSWASRLHAQALLSLSRLLEGG